MLEQQVSLLCHWIATSEIWPQDVLNSGAAVFVPSRSSDIAKKLVERNSEYEYEEAKIALHETEIFSTNEDRKKQNDDADEMRAEGVAGKKGISAVDMKSDNGEERVENQIEEARTEPNEAALHAMTEDRKYADNEVRAEKQIEEKAVSAGTQNNCENDKSENRQDNKEARFGLENDRAKNDFKHVDDDENHPGSGSNDADVGCDWVKALQIAFDAKEKKKEDEKIGILQRIQAWKRKEISSDPCAPVLRQLYWLMEMDERYGFDADAGRVISKIFNGEQKWLAKGSVSLQEAEKRAGAIEKLVSKLVQDAIDKNLERGTDRVRDKNDYRK